VPDIGQVPSNSPEVRFWEVGKGYIVDKAIEDAAFMLERIDKRCRAGQFFLIKMRVYLS
jgi:hypothetical protein